VATSQGSATEGRVGVFDQRRNHLTARPQTSRPADLSEVRVQQLLELVCGASHVGREQGEFALYEHRHFVFDHLVNLPQVAAPRHRSSIRLRSRVAHVRQR
jgi:hypothetical protein